VDFSNDPLARKQIRASSIIRGCSRPPSTSSRYDDPLSFMDEYLLLRGNTASISAPEPSRRVEDMCEVGCHLPSLKSYPI
jgi:hypothetical protein